jgi:hypothetical protein
VGRDEQQVWTRTYERDFKSILALQREVARAVASEIGARFPVRIAVDCCEREPDGLSGLLARAAVLE